nr:MAG TPA_asm: hypothetical protein [Caudoviricetes sp.]
MSPSLIALINLCSCYYIRVCMSSIILHCRM